MPLSRPTLSTLVSRITTDIQSAAGFTTPLLPNSVLRTLGKVYAASVHMLYGFISYMAAQIFPDTAESNYLGEWASIWGITREAATYAAAVLTVTGVNGSNVPAGTLWVDTNGIQYASNASATISGFTAIAVTATTAGSIGTPTVGDTPQLLNPVAGVNTSATVASVTAGQDQETDAALLTRLLARIQTPPQGGALTDYVAWARTVAGVTRAWAFGSQYGAGTVGITFAMDNQVGGPIPSSGSVALVQAAINAVCPVTAIPTVAAPTALPVNFTIHLVGSTTALQTAIQTALQAYIQDYGYPGSTLLVTQMIAQIAANSGGNDFTLSAPSANISVNNLQLATFGAITWD